MSPRSRARPTTPTFATGSTSSGNKLTTPIRYMSLVPVVQVPVDDHDACLEVDPSNGLADDERDQARLVALEHEHVVRGRRGQVIDRAEHDARGVPDSQPFQIRPVILARSTRRERCALDRDTRPDQLDRGIAIVDAAELDQNALLLAFARLDLDSAPSAALLEDPTAEMRDVLARFSV